MFALSNAALTFVAANHLTATEFGEFALLMTTVVITTGIVRALTAEPFTVLLADRDRETTHEELRAALGLSLWLGIVAAIGLLAAGVATDNQGLCAFGIALGPIVVQDCLRFLLIAVDRVRSAFVIDVVWLVVQFACTAIAVDNGITSGASFALWWGAGAGVACGVGFLLLRAFPAPRSARAWWRRTRGYSGYYVLEFAALAGSGYSIVYLVALLSSLADAGAYRGAQALFGPLTNLIGGLRMIGLPAVVRMRPKGKRAIVNAALVVASTLFALSVAAMLAIFLVGDRIGPILLGPSAAAAVALIIPMGLGRAFSSAGAGPLLGLRALGETRSSLATRASVSLLTVGCAAVGALRAGAEGAAWGFALASAVGCAAWLRVLGRGELRLDAPDGEPTPTDPVEVQRSAGSANRFE